MGAFLVAVGLGAGTWFLGRLGAPTDPAAVAAEVARRLKSRVDTELRQALRDQRRPLDLTVEFVEVPDRARDADAQREVLLTGLSDLYPSQIPDGRLIILGPGGSGKTVLLLTLARDMLAAFKSDPARPIPLRVPLANWDAHRIEFDDWLLYELSAITHLPTSSVQPLLEDGRILPLLDGLDEMDAWVNTADAPEDQRSAAAMAKIRDMTDRQAPRRIVLTSRPGTYDRIIGLGLQLHGGSTGNICPLTRHEVFAFVNDAVDIHARWNPVLEDLANTNSRVAGQLATPWLLTVAVSLYERRGAKRQFERNPADLLAGANRPEELMTQFADAFVAGLPRAARARRALQTIARYLVINSGNEHAIGGKILASVDFVVHQLWPIAGMRWPRRLSALITIALWAPALVAAAWTLNRVMWSPIWRLLTLLMVVVLAAVSIWRSTASWPHPRKIELSRFRQDFGRLRLFWSLVIGAGLWGLFTLLGDVHFAGGLAVGFILAFGLGACLTVRDSVGTAQLMSLAAAVVVSPAVAAWWLFGSQGFVTGAVCGMTTGGITLLAVVPLVLRLTDAPSGYVENPVFKSFIAYDIQIGAIVGVFAALTTFLVLSTTPAFRVDQSQAAIVAGTMAIAIGFGAIAEATRRHLAMVLCARGKLTLRLDTLLVGAYEAGLLRRTGIAYQFRHLELRDHFARQST